MADEPTHDHEPDWLADHVKVLVKKREKPTYEEVVEALEGMVYNACSTDAGLDSMASTTNAYALGLLARLGRVEIVEEVGRRVIARPVRRGE